MGSDWMLSIVAVWVVFALLADSTLWPLCLIVVVSAGVLKMMDW